MYRPVEQQVVKLAVKPLCQFVIDLTTINDN